MLWIMLFRRCLPKPKYFLEQLKIIEMRGLLSCCVHCANYLGRFTGKMTSLPHSHSGRIRRNVTRLRDAALEWPHAAA